jgi:hypothetical protein
VPSLASRSLNFLQTQISHPLRIRLSQARRARSVKSLDKFLVHNRPHIDACESKISIDLGSNSNPRNPFHARECYGLDISPSGNSQVVHCDLFREKFPFADSSISSVTAFDFIEHIPRIIVTESCTRFAFVEVMNETFRVLSPGGLFLSYTPAFPFKEAFQDPTHVNIITEDTFPFYFTSSSSADGNSKGYGWLYGFNSYFEMLDQAWHGFRLVTLLRKPSQR